MTCKSARARSGKVGRNSDESLGMSISTQSTSSEHSGGISISIWPDWLRGDPFNLCRTSSTPNYNPVTAIRSDPKAREMSQAQKDTELPKHPPTSALNQNIIRPHISKPPRNSLQRSTTGIMVSGTPAPVNKTGLHPSGIKYALSSRSTLLHVR